jgi:hypothetical protein
MAGRLGAREASRLSQVARWVGSSSEKDVIENLVAIERPWDFFSGSTVFEMIENDSISSVFLVRAYLRAMAEVDLLASWARGEATFEENMEKAALCNLRELEPYYSDSPWSAALEGRDVLVVHPFADSIEKQYRKRSKLFDNPSVLPDFKLLTLRPYMAGLPPYEDVAGFKEKFRRLAQDVGNMKFDVAIIGAGWFGFPLAAEVKRLGRVGIHLGGATQLLFGIRGKRWEDQDFKFFNESWSRPVPSETPPNFRGKTLDFGAYW